MEFGLIGYPLTHSFSKSYFDNKIKAEGLNEHQYSAFPIKEIDEFPALLEKYPNLTGLNVTVPHKISVLKYVDVMDEEAKEIGAVNTLLFKDKKIKGFNTDIHGFQNSLEPHLENHHQSALILGTGGASKAVQYVFKRVGVPFKIVSRNPSGEQLGYSELDKNILIKHKVIINCTPAGMYPKMEAFPDIPYPHLTPQHLIYDLIYNPEETLFLQKAKEAGAKTKNGFEMLQLQADRAWEIWHLDQQ